jgi:hypothetical protein
MPDTADLVVTTPDGQIKLVVEAKTKADATDTWIAKMRKNLLVHDAIPRSPYFILALPDHFYIWKDVTTAATTPPTYSLDSREILEPYLPEHLKDSARNLSLEGLEVVVRTWLEDFVKGEWTTTPESPLFALHELVKNGTVQSGA